MPKENFNQKPFVITFIVRFLSPLPDSRSPQHNSPGFASINMDREDV